MMSEMPEHIFLEFDNHPSAQCYQYTDIHGGYNPQDSTAYIRADLAAERIAELEAERAELYRENERLKEERNRAGVKARSEFLRKLRALEAERRKLVKAAWREGYSDGVGKASYGMTVDVDRDWLESDSRKALAKIDKENNDASS